MPERAAVVEVEGDRMEQNTTGEHAVKVLLDCGGYYPTMECTFDPADTKRPCWPHTEYGERFSDEEGTKAGCVYIDWMGELGSESIVGEVHLRFSLGSAVWD